MKELIVVSGKGGTGKTMLTAGFALLDPAAVAADVDVDAANLGFLLTPETAVEEDFFAGAVAHVDPGRCAGCGVCVSHCRFGALRFTDGVVVCDPAFCEGCGVCVTLCPHGAVNLEPLRCGAWFAGPCRAGWMVHARLEPGSENSGKLVAKVRAAAREFAIERGATRVIVDGPPGLGCPVVSALTGADVALVVAEPTPAGAEDCLRVVKLVRHLGMPALLCVNKWDLNPELCAAIEVRARTLGAIPLGRVRYDPAVTEALRHGLATIESASPAADEVRALWWRIDEFLTSGST